MLILTSIFDTLLAPLAAWPLAALIAASALSGILMAIAFRYTSNQKKLKELADRSRAQVLAIKLFGDDPRTIFAALAKLLRYTGLRLLYSLPPALVMLVPFVIVLVQLGLRFEYQPLAPGQAAIVKLELKEQDWPKYQIVELQPPSQIALETPALRDAAEHAIYWRIRPREATDQPLRWTNLGDEPIEKQIQTAADPERVVVVEPRRPSASWLDRFLHPAEPPCPATSPAEAIDVTYPPRSTPLLGLDLPWWLTFITISIIAALLAKPFVKVQF